MCYMCLSGWHQGITCDQALENEYNKWHKRIKVKLCPFCKSKIEKNGGCNHMTCGKCKKEFCWLCKNKYSGNHYGINNFCGCPGMQYSERDSRPIFLLIWLMIICRVVLDLIKNFNMKKMISGLKSSPKCFMMLILHLIPCTLMMTLWSILLPVLLLDRSYGKRIKVKIVRYAFIYSIGIILGIVFFPFEFIFLLLGLISCFCDGRYDYWNIFAGFIGNIGEVY